MDKHYVLGIDIGGTNFRMGIVDNTYHLDRFERHSSREMLAQNAVDSLVGTIREYLDRNREFPVERVAIGVPGQVARDHSTVYSIPKVQGIQNMDLGKTLTEAPCGAENILI